MAYREWYKTAPILQNDYSPLAEGVSTLFQTLAQKREAKRKAVDQYKYALEYGHFENDNKFNTEYVQKVNKIGKETLKKSLTYTPELINAEQQGLQYVADQKAQYKRFENLHTQISKRETDDKYYNANADRKALEIAAFGEKGDVDFRTRGQRLDAVAKGIGNDPISFKFLDYRSDYIKGRGTKTKINASNEPGSVSSEYKSPFVNHKTGKPEVTDTDAVDFIGSEPRVDQWYDYKVSSQIDQEIAQMKAVKNPKNDWMNGLSDEEIKLELIVDPSKNRVNKQEFGQRKRELAKKDLEAGADIYQKVDYEKKKDDSATGGLYSNDAIAHTYTFSSIPTGSSTLTPGEAEQIGQNSLNGPGGILMINKGVTTGKPINFDTQSRNAYNIRSGKRFTLTGKQPFNVTGYQLQLYRKNGQPYLLQASNEDELVNAIGTIPPDQFKDLMPEPKIALVGYTLDRARMLGDISNNSYDLNKELGNARASGDNQKVATIEQQLASLEELRQNINDENFSEADILNMAANNQITSVRTDQLILAEKADLDKVNNITGGLNLTDQSKWSDDMKRFNQAYKEAYGRFANVVPKQEGSEPKTPAKKTTIPIVDSQDGYNALSSGAEYIGPDGVKRRKK